MAGRLRGVCWPLILKAEDRGRRMPCARKLWMPGEEDLVRQKELGTDGQLSIPC